MDDTFRRVFPSWPSSSLPTAAAAPATSPTGNPTPTHKSEGLCNECGLIDFRQFNTLLSPVNESVAADPNVYVISLFNIIKHSKKRKCTFCMLLFDAIVRNDPFNHPAIREHMPKKQQDKSFEAWARGISWFEDNVMSIPHPLGRGRNKIELEQSRSGEGNAEMIEVRNKGHEAAMQSGVIVTAGAAGAATQGAASEKNDGLKGVFSALGAAGSLAASVIASKDFKLPAAVCVTVHGVGSPNAGLIEVGLYGYGNSPQAQLSLLCFFNLRVASKYQSAALGLRYGNLMEEKVRVESDCKVWLRDCTEQHGKNCGEPAWSKNLRPPSGEHFRLIDVLQNKVVQPPFGSKGIKYAALSYVWGEAGKQALQLRVENLMDLSKSLIGHDREVARTVSDAIEVAKRLKIRYLWVDSLCIIQEPENTRGRDDLEARQSQIRQMDSIYSSAQVVIVAAAGKDAASGLTGISSPRVTGQLQIAKEVVENVNVLLAVQYDKSYGKWDTRGWTLQEKMLSKRMLVFGESYVSFHCRHGILREDMPAIHAGNGPPQFPYLSMSSTAGKSLVKHNWNTTPLLMRSPFFSEYAKLLEQYTSRDMTKPKDFLSGVMGLLTVLEAMRRSNESSTIQTEERQAHILYGLPEEFLDISLLWQPPAAKGVLLVKRNNKDAPSWSWAGWQVSKDNRAGEIEDEKHHARPGIRFEEPFRVAANEDLSLKKHMAHGEQSEERFRPLILWYKCVVERDSNDYPHSRPVHSTTETGARLVPINGNGLGFACGSDAIKIEKQFIERARQYQRSYRPSGFRQLPYIPPDIPLSDRNLVCETQQAKFKLSRKPQEKATRIETLWDREGGKLFACKQFEINEVEILDEEDKIVGHMILTCTSQNETILTEEHVLIVMSDSQYWGNEERVDVVDLPLFNVMAIKWDTRREFAERVGMGKIFKSAWMRVQPEWTRVILE
ncbi:heterokaryon incompatibility protein-domain-containing protein [Colletotrichum phormii]|uniref:Heterokaryon incompatibility protein-domain-containing protein n=1 Tax=Colletotrichum phormii TaxID=359342 RepID=A0AAJ0EM44_9PEZI|nr:heterokaryon incompatibility protein-domain-containing protein [Colletotrichum phormii]KAK1641515.1 heterokaryon incompatibility protein-domain-containing protein [Colletotrichum phormii]